MGRAGFDLLKDFAERLRRDRAFDDLYVLTSEMNADGLDTPRTRHLEIQALIELGVFETALRANPRDDQLLDRGHCVSVVFADVFF